MKLLAQVCCLVWLPFVACQAPDGPALGDTSGLHQEGDLTPDSLRDKDVPTLPKDTSREAIGIHDLVADTTTPYPSAQCFPCASDSDCVTGRCLPFGGGTFCLEECQTSLDCGAGQVCSALASGGKQCVPVRFDCDAECLVRGCEAGKVCDQNSWHCVTPKQLCEPCNNSWECADGLGCDMEHHTCATRCGAFWRCPENSACIDPPDGTPPVCRFNTGKCCSTTDCEWAVCPPELPERDGDICMPCVEGHRCNSIGYCEQGLCVPQEMCPLGLPFKVDGECVECILHSDCPQQAESLGSYCSGGTCFDTEIGCLWCQECSYCVDPYPGCRQVQGIWICVQCTADDMCPAGQKCDLDLLACEKVPEAGPGCGQCLLEEEWVSTLGVNLKCDVGSGCWYDPLDGSCDSVEVNCKGGARCIGLMGLLSSSGTPGSYLSAPLTTTPGTGTCECQNPLEVIPDPVQCQMGNCPTSPECVKGSCVSPAMLGQILGGGIWIFLRLRAFASISHRCSKWISWGSSHEFVQDVVDRVAGSFGV